MQPDVENAIHNDVDGDGAGRDRVCRRSRKHRRKCHRGRRRAGDVDIEIDDDGGSASIETDEGSIQIGGNEIPDDFPLPIPDYEELAGVVTQSIDGSEPTQIIVSFDPDDIDKVADLYEEFFNDQGWETSRTDASAGDVRNVFVTRTSDDVDAGAAIGYSGDDDVATLSLSYISSG